MLRNSKETPMTKYEEQLAWMRAIVNGEGGFTNQFREALKEVLDDRDRLRKALVNLSILQSEHFWSVWNAFVADFVASDHEPPPYSEAEEVLKQSAE